MGLKAQLWFYKGKGKWMDKLIRWWTKSSYSHVEIVHGSFAYSADAWSNKVRADLVLNFTRENWDVVEVDLSKDLQWIQAQLGKGYDWLGILGYITLSFQDPQRWYCSELAAAAMGLDNRQVSPGELYEIVTGARA